MKVARTLDRLERQRPPELGPTTIEDAPSRHHSDDRVPLTIECDAVVEDRRVCAKSCRPQAIAQDHDMVFTRLLFVGRERAAKCRPNAEHVEVPRRASS